MPQQMMQQQMPPQMLQQQQMQQQMRQQQMMQQQIPPQMMQQQMPTQMMQQQMPPNVQRQQPPLQQFQHLPPQQQQQILNQIVGQQKGQQELLTNVNSNEFDINALLFSNRDSLVLLLLYLILLTPQINDLMVKIPYTSDNGSYPNYLGILIRGIFFIGFYILFKKLNML